MINSCRSLLDDLVACYLQNQASNKIQFVLSAGLPTYDEQRSIRDCILQGSEAEAVMACKYCLSDHEEWMCARCKRLCKVAHTKPDFHRIWIALQLSGIESFMVDGDKLPIFEFGAQLPEQNGLFVGVGVWQGESIIMTTAGALFAGRQDFKVVAGVHACVHTFTCMRTRAVWGLMFMCTQWTHLPAPLSIKHPAGHT